MCKIVGTAPGTYWACNTGWITFPKFYYYLGFTSEIYIKIKVLFVSPLLYICIIECKVIIDSSYFQVFLSCCFWKKWILSSPKPKPIYSLASANVIYALNAIFPMTVGII